MKIGDILFCTTLIGALILAGCTDPVNEHDNPENTFNPLFNGTIEGFENRWNSSTTTHPDTLCIFAVKTNNNVIVGNWNYIPQESTLQSPLLEENQQPVSLKENEQYQFYSFRKGTTTSAMGTGGIGVTLETTQVQQKGDDNSHIRRYDFLHAKAETNKTQIDFHYHHTFALLELELPSGITAVTLKAEDPDEEYAGDRSFSFQNNNWSSTPFGQSSVCLLLKQPTVKDNEKAWIVVYPGHESKPFDLIIQTTDYRIYRIPHTPPPTGLVAGQTYSLKVNLQDARSILDPPTRSGEIWQIANIRHMEWFRDNVNCGATELDVRLTADIDLQCNSHNTWWPIGINNRYKGHFDGNGHHISGLYIDNIKNNSGLWSEVESPSCIEKIKLSGEIKGGDGKSAGSIVANLRGGVIQQCHSNVNITVNNASSVGGVAAYSSGTISNCYYDGQIKITGSYGTTGTVLGLNDGLIENCYTAGALSYTSTIVGGICGGNFPNSEIRNCATLCSDWQDKNDARGTTIGRITGFNQGVCNNNIARSDLNVGGIFANDKSLQGLSKDPTTYLSPKLYRDELGWSPQIWLLIENTLPTLSIFN